MAARVLWEDLVPVRVWVPRHTNQIPLGILIWIFQVLQRELDPRIANRQQAVRQCLRATFRVWVPRCGCSLMAKSQISNLIMRVRFPSPAHTSKHMSKKLKKRIKKFLFPGTALIVSLYISALFTIGIVIGYFGITFFNKNFIKTGRIEPLVIEIGKWHIHLHHWIQGSLVFSAIIVFQSSLFLFWLGAMGAVVFHDINTDKE